VGDYLYIFIVERSASAIGGTTKIQPLA